MPQEENTFYSPYQGTIPYQDIPQTSTSGGVGVLNPPIPEQSGIQPPKYPSGPQAEPTPPPRRRGRGGPIIVLALVLLIIFGVGLFAGWEFASGKTTSVATSTTTSSAPASSANSSAVETQQEAAIAKVEPAVVELDVRTAQGEAIGSGVIIDSNGDIVTNNHVVSGAQTISAVLSNGKTVQAQLVGNSAADDLAVVRIVPFANMAVAQIGDSSKLVVGQQVMAIGNPLGITQTATTGIISALNRNVTESQSVTISNAIQTDASINPGNSGGALINLQGQLIGIPTLGAVDSEFNTPANGVGFAIPSSRVVTVVHQILQQG